MTKVLRNIALDTAPLAEMLRQYFSANDRRVPIFNKNENLPDDAVKKMNKIVRSDVNQIIASVLAFVELARNWDKLMTDNCKPYQLYYFLRECPDWFKVEDMDYAIISYLRDVPNKIESGGKVLNIEWTDAIHVAAARINEAWLVTSDSRIWAINDADTIKVVY